MDYIRVGDGQEPHSVQTFLVPSSFSAPAAADFGQGVLIPAADSSCRHSNSGATWRGGAAEHYIRNGNRRPAVSGISNSPKLCLVFCKARFLGGNYTLHFQMIDSAW